MISKNQQKRVKALEQKKHRRQEGLFVAEGVKTVGDLMGRMRPVTVFATETWMSGHAVDDQVETVVVTEEELHRLSFVQHPQQVLALFPLPQPAVPGRLKGLTLGLDGVQDPGNLGTIIRLADWFGIGTICCSEGTADAWSPKTVQATMGSIARVNIVYTDLPRLIDRQPEDYPVYGTFLDGQSIYEQALTAEGLIIMGNEGRGISSEVAHRVNHRLLIPSYGRGDTAESLNVAIATAITCAEFRRRAYSPL